MIAVVKTNSGFSHAGAVVAQSGCWSMLKGGLTVDSSGPAEIYFEVSHNIILFSVISESQYYFRLTNELPFTNAHSI